ncbi:hypothetical protein C9374_009355 [Naegleria lovaniensis]|uniref:Uncharacterized protein n=1 Tax=Naegleria lovaniensis TaxID=51637 RepID=A0AA88KK37_NAELO|nr:uncharacterized protein C9374_009355 [Naegleria lovaniensis]KAG2377444.1 hypothetical protein C9374_009355 [Naegleria lovaniensis]
MQKFVARNANSKQLSSFRFCTRNVLPISDSSTSITTRLKSIFSFSKNYHHHTCFIHTNIPTSSSVLVHHHQQSDHRREFSRNVLALKKSGVENDPLLKMLDFAKQEVRMKEDGFKKTKDGRFYTKTYIDPEMMTPDEKQEYESGTFDDVNEQDFESWMKKMEKEERVMSRSHDESFLNDTIPGEMKDFSFSDLLDEAEQYLIHGKPIPFFNRLADHVPRGEREDIFKRTDYSHLKDNPPTMKDVQQMVKFTEMGSVNNDEKKDVFRKKDGKIDYVKTERRMYYQASKKSTIENFSEVEHDEEEPGDVDEEKMEYDTPEDFERIKVPDDAFSAYHYFRNEVYLRKVDYPKSREEEEQEISEFFIEAYHDPHAPKSYNDDTEVKEFLLKKYNSFDKALATLETGQSNATPLTAVNRLFEIKEELLKNQKKKKDRKADQILDRITQLNRVVLAKGQMDAKFEYDPSTGRVERKKRIVEQDVMYEPIKSEDISEENKKSNAKLPKAELIGDTEDDIDEEIMTQYMKDLESGETYEEEATTEEILLSRLMRQVNPNKLDVENFTESELRRLQELVHENKDKFAKLSSRKRRRSYTPRAPTMDMFLPSDSELEKAIEKEFGITYEQFNRAVEENPQYAQIMGQLGHDADFAFRALSQAIVEMGGTQKIEEKLNEESKVNRSFGEWMNVFKSDPAMANKSFEEIVQEYSKKFKKK